MIKLSKIGGLWLLSALFFLPWLSHAQESEIKVMGKVLEAGGTQPIPYATVIALELSNNVLISGTTTQEDGSFELSIPSDRFYIEVSFIGYRKQTITDFQQYGNSISLGNILLEEDSKVLDEVVVQGERSNTEFKLDRRVFNIGKDLSNTGASALDVLNDVPSVSVSVEGRISLRGSTGVQILINGKPSILTSEEGNALGTITADMIEKIEVITNPSAKYNAEGTSGIINIIIKKEERTGTNGSFTINTGTPHNHSFGLSLNRRTEKFNLFSQLGVGYRELPNKIKNINTDLTNNTTVFTTGKEYRNETFYNAILGTDYHINPNNVITISGNFAYEVEDQPSHTDFSFAEGTTTTSVWNREEVTEATNPKYQYELQYKREYPDHEDHALIFSAQGSFFGKDLSSVFVNTTISGEDHNGNQQTRSDFQEGEYTFKLDYTKPFKEVYTLETGAQYVINDVSNDYAVSNLVSGTWVVNPDFANIFEYDQKVLGAYGTGAYEKEKWGIKIGLRLENTDLKTHLVSTDESNHRNYTNFFPTFHTSYKLTDNYSVQAGYSKRIFRPRLWDLNPFFNIRNTYSIRTGNPNLQPEFTNSYEINSIYAKDELSVNMGVYYRYTTAVIERVSSFEDNVSTTRPLNIGTNRATGLEFNAKYSVAKWLTINADFNYNYFNREGELESTNFAFTANQWSSRLNTKFKLPASIDFEITGNYRSGYRTVQGRTSENIFADLGLRKKILKGKGIINFSIRDVFASRIMITEATQQNFEVYNRQQRGRFVTVGFSYGFGKGEAMEFTGRRR